MLPPELRNLIYELILPRSSVVTIPKDPNAKESPLLCTCKQIRQEGLSAYYANNDIRGLIDLETKMMVEVVRELDAIVSTCGPKPFFNFQISFYHTVWPYLDKMLPLLELLRRTGFEPATKPYRLPEKSAWDGVKDERDTSVFSLQSKGRLQFVLEKALCWARRARAEGWSRERLAKAYTKFVAEQSSRKGHKKGKIFVEGKAL
jgi:hypothetical protein